MVENSSDNYSSIKSNIMLSENNKSEEKKEYDIKLFNLIREDFLGFFKGKELSVMKIKVLDVY